MRSRKVSKHTTYFELLDSIRSATGCPLCEIEAKSIRRYFDSLLYENVNDHVVREALIRSEATANAMRITFGIAEMALALLFYTKTKLNFSCERSTIYRQSHLR